MIFVTVGSQKFPFDRLLEAIDALTAQKVIQEEVFAQIGYSNYKPSHFSCVDFMDRNAFERRIHAADIIITHGGTGVIIKSVKMGKCVIAVPRLSQYGEHVDDHQIQLITEFQKANMLISCMDTSELPAALEKAKEFRPLPYQSNSQKIMDNIEKYLHQLI